MRGLGTIINVTAIVFGGILGMTVGKRMRERLQETLRSAIGISTMFLGAGGALARCWFFPGER